MKRFVHSILLPTIFLLSFFSSQGQSVSTYYPKVDKISHDNIHIMQVTVEQNQVYVVFRYNIEGKDQVSMSSNTTLQCGSFISSIKKFGVLSDSTIQHVLPFNEWFDCSDSKNMKYASKPFTYLDDKGEEKISRSFDFFLVFPGKLPEYAQTITINENAGERSFKWEGIHINNFRTEEEW